MQSHHFHWHHRCPHFHHSHKTMLDAKLRLKWKIIGKHIHVEKFLTVPCTQCTFISIDTNYNDSIGHWQTDWFLFLFCFFVSSELFFFSFTISGAKKNRLTAHFDCGIFSSFVFPCISFGHIHGNVAACSGVRQQNDSLLMIYHHDQVVAIGK